MLCFTVCTVLVNDINLLPITIDVKLYMLYNCIKNKYAIDKFIMPEG